MDEKKKTDEFYPLDPDMAFRQAIAYGRDLARLFREEKQRRQDLEVAHQTLTAIFSSMPDPLAVVNGEDIIEAANPAFLRLIEADGEMIIGKKFFDWLPSFDLQNHLRQFRENNLKRDEFEFTMIIPFRRSLLTSIASRGDDDKGVVIVFHDQSDKKRLEYQKAEFINIAAHELRTPLAGILGFTEILKFSVMDKGLEDEIESLDAIIASSVQLKDIIDELLQFAELNEGALAQEGMSHFRLATILQDVMEEAQGLAREKGVSLKLRLFTPDIEMFADPSLMRMALNQLILNGINFNVDGGNVEVEVVQRDEHVYIRVIDTGIGIPQTELDEIFDAFYQIQGHQTRSVGGLGLGLSIVRYAVDQLGGEIKVQSVLSEGSNFILTLPLRQETVIPQQRPFFT